MAKVYYVGDWAVLLGPVFAETPFYRLSKGVDIYNYAIQRERRMTALGLSHFR
jgi:hypothetical protein